MPKQIVWLLFSFNGRLGRLGFFTAWLGLALVSAVLQVATVGNALHRAGEQPDVALVLLRAALGFAVAYCHFAIQAKRFHDFNWSGWWVLAPGAALTGLAVLWIFGLVANAGSGAEGAPTFVGLGLLTLGAGLFIIVVGLMLMFRSGTAGPNSYGPRSGPPVEEERGSEWAQRILDDPLAAAERLREQESRNGQAPTSGRVRPTTAAAAAPSGERVFGRRGARA